MLGGPVGREGVGSITVICGGFIFLESNTLFPTGNIREHSKQALTAVATI